MRRLIFTIGLVLVCATAVAQSPTAQPAPFVVIVHPGNQVSSVTRSFLADVFLKRTTRWPNGDPVRPADLRVDSPARRRFSEAVLSRSVAAVRSYWQRIIFSGRGVPPIELDDEAAAVRFVSRTRGAIAYVSDRADIGRVKMVAVR